MSAQSSRIVDRLSLLMAETEGSPELAVRHNGRLANESAEVRERVASARAAFKEGFREVLGLSANLLPTFFRHASVHRRGFALEGGAMAVTLLDEFNDSVTPRRLARLLHRRSVGQRHLIALGVGMASARLGRTIEWMPPDLHGDHESAVADGYGFHQAFFHAHRFSGRGFPARDGQPGAHYDIGLGRGIFFATFGCPKVITAVIGSMPQERRHRLWHGVGAAYAFTGAQRCADPGASPNSKRFELHFQAGIERGTHLAALLARSTESGYKSQIITATRT